MRFSLTALRESFINHWDLLALAGVIGLALVLRLMQLASVPGNVTADELDTLQTIYQILAGTGPGFFGLDWTQSPAYSTYVMAGTMKLFGHSIEAMRLSSVVHSVLALIPFYFLAKQLVSRHAALAATFLLSTSLWYLHFSRSGWYNIFGALYGVAAALALSMAIQRRSRLLYGVCGLFCALGLLSYSASNFIIAGILAYLPFALLVHRQQRKQVLLGYGILVLVALVVFAPQLVTMLSDWARATLRLRTVSVFSLKEPYLGDATIDAVLRSQVLRVLRGFFLMDTGVMAYGLWGRYVPLGRAFLDMGTAVFYWVGLVASLYYWRRTLLWWTMFLALLAPQVFSFGTPDAARGVGSAPFMYLFVALGLHAVFSLLMPQISKLLSPRLARPLVAAGFVSLFVFIAVVNVGAYVNWMRAPDSLRLREPAVEQELFPYWRELAQQSAREGKLFSTAEWLKRREQILRR